jgi:hypothetical protein
VQRHSQEFDGLIRSADKHDDRLPTYTADEPLEVSPSAYASLIGSAKQEVRLFLNPPEKSEFNKTITLRRQKRY